MALDVEIADVELLEESGDYKVVQIALNNALFLLLGDPWQPETALHGGVLRKFLSERGIDFETVEGQSSAELVPAPCGESHRVLGMGIATVDLERRRVKFYGVSADYGIRLDIRRLYKRSMKEKELDIRLPL